MVEEVCNTFPFDITVSLSCCGMQKQMLEKSKAQSYWIGLISMKNVTEKLPLIYVLLFH